MNKLRTFLMLSTVMIFTLTTVVSIRHGINWPAVAIGDLLSLNWRTQFDSDFLVYLILAALWISWREGFSVKGHIFGVVSIVLGGMFSFPYLLLAAYKAEGDPKLLLLGVQGQNKQQQKEL